MVSKQVGTVGAAEDCALSCMELVALQERHSRSAQEGWPTSATTAGTTQSPSPPITCRHHHQVHHQKGQHIVMVAVR